MVECNKLKMFYFVVVWGLFMKSQKYIFGFRQSRDLRRHAYMDSFASIILYTYTRFKIGVITLGVFWKYKKVAKILFYNTQQGICETMNPPQQYRTYLLSKLLFAFPEDFTYFCVVLWACLSFILLGQFCQLILETFPDSQACSCWVLQKMYSFSTLIHPKMFFPF